MSHINDVLPNFDMGQSTAHKILILNVLTSSEGLDKSAHSCSLSRGITAANMCNGVEEDSN